MQRQWQQLQKYERQQRTNQQVQRKYATVSNDHETSEGTGMVRQMTRTPQRGKNRKGTIEPSVIGRLAIENPDLANLGNSIPKIRRERPPSWKGGSKESLFVLSHETEQCKLAAAGDF